MAITSNTTRQMEKIDTAGLIPENCLLCGFCELYNAEKQRCQGRSLFKKCPAGRGNIYVKATLLGTRGEFHQAYCKALNAAVLLAVWNYTADNIATEDGATTFMEDLENIRSEKTLAHTPSVDVLRLGKGFTEEVGRAWRCLMTYQIQKRLTDNRWWTRKDGALQHATNTFGNPKTKVAPEELRPQDEVPRNRLIHYIIKDYRRMYNTYDTLLEKAKSQEAEIKKLQEEMSGVKGGNRGIQKERELWGKEREKYKKMIADLQNSRSAVVEAVTDDLQEQVKELQRQNRLLAEAVINPQKAEEAVRVVTLTTNVATPAEREWMKRSTKQLDKAYNDLTTVKERLISCMEGIEKAYKEGFVEDDTKKLIKKYTSTLSKIDAATAHIGVFFEKIDGIEFE